MSAIKTFLQLLAILAVAALGGLFALANDQLISVDLLIWVAPQWSSGVWLLLTLALGVLLGFSLAAVQYRLRLLRNRVVERRTAQTHTADQAN